MQGNVKKLFGIIALAALLGTCSIVSDTLAQEGVPGNNRSGAIGGSGGGIKNPLENSGVSTVTQLLGKVINWMLGLVGVIALIALITGGARMIMDFGNEEQVKKGKTTIMWAVIGLLVVILSYAIINIVTGEILGTSYE